MTRQLRILTLTLFLGLSLTACGKSGTVSTDAPIGTEVFHVVMPTKEQRENPVHGDEQWFAYGAISGKAIPASGVANMQFFRDGTFAVSMRVNIEIPAKGKHYEAWIANGQKKIHIGTITSPTDDVRMSLVFEKKQDLRAYTTLLVTRESDENTATEGELVAEGTVKYYKR